MLAFSIFTFWTIGQYSTASRNYLAKRRLLLSSPFLSFSFRASHTGTKGRVNPFDETPCQTQVQPFKKGVSNCATQDSIMNIHNNIQITYVKIKCVLKDSSYDTPYKRFSCSQYLLLVRVQARKIVSKCPHMKNDSIFTHRG
ncbi:hypothetical protein H5410_050803 [Solanum commersonii]|uniref:Secreted protein n=1 Tax=Solanum commersonii TaxID=4109 RepID=A0A9J5WZ23_SOLCO|nr:hypothetical protein H5410_050803 [Solanum commersonii]